MLRRPSVAPAYEALKPGHASLDLQLDGSATLFEGDTLEWDTGESTTVRLRFVAPWYLRRALHIVIWSEQPAEIILSSPAAVASELVKLEPSAGQPTGRRIQIPILDEGDGLVEVIRLTAKRTGGSAGRISFGFEGQRADLQTRVNARWAMQFKLLMLAATWAVMFTMLFLVGRAIGFGPLAPVAPVLALVPTVLSLLGAQWANAFKVNRIAMRLVRALPRWMQVAWTALGGAATGLLAYVIVAFLVYAQYRWELSDAISGTTSIEELAELFCRYPERVEVRAALTRKLHTGATPGARAALYGVAARHLQDRFETGCPPPSTRLARWFYEVPAVRRDDARIFYASLWWNALDVDVAEFYTALGRIRAILKEPPASTRLARLTLVKYETRLRMNLNESIYCNRELSRTDDCQRRRRECAEWRTKLLDRLQGHWDQSEADSVAYLEARDVAGSSFVFQGCASEPVPKLAIDQWRRMTDAIPEGRVVLDDLLGQLNFRKLVDGWLDTVPHHPSSEAWKDGCPGTYGGTCQLLKDAFIANEKQVFFGPSRAARRAEWERASIPFLDSAKFPDRIRELAGKDWKWPL